jgi:hypothetical protein
MTDREVILIHATGTGERRGGEPMGGGAETHLSQRPAAVPLARLDRLGGVLHEDAQFAA